MKIVKVLNCPISWIMLCDVESNILYIFDLSELNAVYEAREFD
jgi:hypothetical protein